MRDLTYFAAIGFLVAFFVAALVAGNLFWFVFLVLAVVVLLMWDGGEHAGVDDRPRV
ncbi:hypothetical protein [Gulosibacter molinativorax]|uniref:hypothetical protein n=1 Tax=Gulosibacter molinativorax TaxID=256821 RepID=UPI0015E690FC|nr:hypothetical protein [Gulosibacter molinativorax]QUY63308.1 Hypotetical protein [Gulosibacter molinativorax]